MRIPLRKEVGRWARAWMHFPVGLLIIGLMAAGVYSGELFVFLALLTISILLFRSFLVYEVIQGSKAHLDIVGLPWGLGFGGVVWALCEWLI